MPKLNEKRKAKLIAAIDFAVLKLRAMASDDHKAVIEKLINRKNNLTQ